MSLRILLITPEFYGFEKQIRSTLELSGYEVLWIENKSLLLDYHGTNSKFKLLRRIFFFLYSPHVKYVKKELRKISDLKFDILFSINANIVCSHLFKKLKRYNPEIHSILFLWDSFSMYNWSKEIKYFNEVITFDRADSIKYQIKYKPNFFIRNRDSDPKKNEYDLFFAGKFTPERHLFLEKITGLLPSHQISSWIKVVPVFRNLLHGRIVYHLVKDFKSFSNWIRKYILNYEAVEDILKREYIGHTVMPFDEVWNHLEASNVVLDIPYSGQTGYSHNFIKALSWGRKVITTNHAIKDESFFNPDQIMVIDERSPEIDFSWIKEKASFPVHSSIGDLELSKWLKAILNADIA